MTLDNNRLEVFTSYCTYSVSRERYATRVPLYFVKILFSSSSSETFTDSHNESQLYSLQKCSFKGVPLWIALLFLTNCRKSNQTYTQTVKILIRSLNMISQMVKYHHPFTPTTHLYILYIKQNWFVHYIIIIIILPYG